MTARYNTLKKLIRRFSDLNGEIPTLQSQQLMSRRTEATVGYECPYCFNRPRLSHLSITWTLEVYPESFRLRDVYLPRARR